MDQPDRQTHLRQLVASPAGQAHLLSLAVVAEEGDELGFFDMVADAVDDPRLARLVRRHQNDELRHAQLYRGCLARLGLELQEVPDELRFIRQLRHHLPEDLEIGVHSPVAIAGTYALLYAVEKRGVEQFPMIAEAWRPVDAETADTYLTVTQDEHRHIRFCDTVGRHFAARESAWQEAVDQASQVEQATFEAVRQADIAYTTRQGLLQAA